MGDGEAGTSHLVDGVFHPLKVTIAVYRDYEGVILLVVTQRGMESTQMRISAR
jgi:hypothetical protein